MRLVQLSYNEMRILRDILGTTIENEEDQLEQLSITAQDNLECFKRLLDRLNEVTL